MKPSKLADSFQLLWSLSKLAGGGSVSEASAHRRRLSCAIAHVQNAAVLVVHSAVFIYVRLPLQCRPEYPAAAVARARLPLRRRQIKERSKEDHLYGDKEKFVTAAYKKKLQEARRGASSRTTPPVRSPPLMCRCASWR